MKKMFLISALTLLMVGGMCLNAAAQKTTRYWVVFASYDDPDSNDPKYAVTDVVKVTCDENKTGVLLQFNKHIKKKYDDVFGRSNGNTAVEPFDTYEKAVNWRKKKIAEKEDKDYEVVKVSGFSIYCDD